jgi:tetratricopeptide (TPR) repeat protein
MSAKTRTKAKSNAARSVPRKDADSPSYWLPWAWAGVLLLFALIAYSHAIGCGFIWDDDYYVEANETLHSIDGLRRIWFEPGAVPQYYPLVHTTFWVEYHLWGLHPAGYHLVNVLLHATGAVLLWRLLARLGLPGAWLAAAIFAVHPVEVESVAWITERKNVLSAVFALAAILAYLQFSPPETVNDGATQPLTAPRWRAYFLAFVLFVAALLSKTVAVSVPAVLLVILWWKRGKISWRDLTLLGPFFVIGISLALVTVTMEKNTVGAVGAAWDLSFVGRCLVAGHALWFYAGKLLWPVGLNFFYPRWDINTHDLWQYVYPAAALAVLLGLWLARGRVGRGPLAAVLIFAGVLVPALGFFNVYPFRYSFVADHFQYHASMALIALMAAIATIGWRRLGDSSRWLGALTAAAVLIVSGVLTWQRTFVYDDQLTLFTDVVARDPKSWIGHNNLGTLYLQKDVPQGIAHLSIALRLQPTYTETHIAFAAALAEIGECQRAIELLEQALAVPDVPQSRRALACNSLAWILATCRDERQRDPQRAVAMAEEAVHLAPDVGALQGTLGAALYRAGDLAKATEALEKSVKANGGYSADRFFLAMINEKLGNHEEALRFYREGVMWRQQHEPQSAEALRIEAEAAKAIRPTP